MILKILLVLGVIAVVYYFFIRKPVPAQRAKGPKNREDTLVPCETCGTFVSIDEALVSNGRYYCSEPCMQKA